MAMAMTVRLRTASSQPDGLTQSRRHRDWRLLHSQPAATPCSHHQRRLHFSSRTNRSRWRRRPLQSATVFSSDRRVINSQFRRQRRADRDVRVLHQTRPQSAPEYFLAHRAPPLADSSTRPVLQRRADGVAVRLRRPQWKRSHRDRDARRPLGCWRSTRIKVDPAARSQLRLRPLTQLSGITDLRDSHFSSDWISDGSSPLYWPTTAAHAVARGDAHQQSAAVAAG